MGLENVPTECPDCGVTLHLRSQPRWRHSKLSKLLFVVAGMAALAGFAYILQLVHYPDIPVRIIVEGIIVFTLLLLSGFVGHKLPRVRELHCHRCEWRCTLHSTADHS